jgi:hypothetical protein
VQGDIDELYVFTPGGISLLYEWEEMAAYLPAIDDERWYLRPAERYGRLPISIFGAILHWEL